ncbi:hypothetical protein ACLQ28_22350 [Micromonospora sp. DT201]|uniref:hypothetical protein n=1 Tax=Micromonospora sp. DT201 TaxID=3393442 RepID=UPI003CEB2AFE
MSPEPMPPSRAVEDLARAASIAAQAQIQSRWLVTFLALLGAAFGGITAALGLLGSTPARVAAITVIFFLVVGGLLIWYFRQRVIPRDLGRRYVPFMMATCSLYVVTLGVGRPLFTDRPEYWVPAAVLVALPLLVGAWRGRGA